MKGYYIYIDHAQHGPFSLDELRARHISRDTPVWHVGMPYWMPASEIDELRMLFETGATPPDARNSRSSGQQAGQGKKPSSLAIGARLRMMSGVRKGVLIGVVTLIVLAVATYANMRWVEKSRVQHKQEIRKIHEVEVQKAIKELREEKLRQQAAKMTEAQRRELLKKRSIELKSLKAQLSSTLNSHRRAVMDLEDIEGFKLFRSRAKKEAQVAAQLRIIRSLEDRANALRSRIGKCQQDIERITNAMKAGE